MSGLTGVQYNTTSNWSAYNRISRFGDNTSSSFIYQSTILPSPLIIPNFTTDLINQGLDAAEAKINRVAFAAGSSREFTITNVPRKPLEEK